jgi:hypothetical protein
LEPIPELIGNLTRAPGDDGDFPMGCILNEEYDFSESHVDAHPVEVQSVRFHGGAFNVGTVTPERLAQWGHRLGQRSPQDIALLVAQLNRAL